MLRQADGEELAAAGRAVLMLIEEIERLQLELRRTSHGEADRLEPSSTLQQRLQRVLQREPAEEARSPAGGDEAVASQQAWIDSLRQQT